MADLWLTSKRAMQFSKMNASEKRCDGRGLQIILSCNFIFYRPFQESNGIGIFNRRQIIQGWISSFCI